MSQPIVVIIPGIGDHTPSYDVFAWVWRRLGYETHIIPFGWTRYYADIATHTRDFMHKHKLDAVAGKDDVYLIGVSAGGTAAVHAFANRQSVRKVITVSSPFEDADNLEHRLLVDSIIAVRRDLEQLDAAEKANILSVYGIFDRIVPTYMSRPEGVRTKRIFAFGHAPIIFMALTFHGLRLKRFFSKKR